MDRELTELALQIRDYIKRNPDKAIYVMNAAQNGFDDAVNYYKSIAQDLEICLVLQKTSPKQNKDFISEKMAGLKDKTWFNSWKFFGKD